MGNTYAQTAEKLRDELEARAEKYGQQFSEFKSEHLVAKVGELIANFEDGSGNLTVKDIRARIQAAFPPSTRVHPSRK